MAETKKDWPFGQLKQGHYRVILADPPWKTEVRSDKGLGKSPEQHYETMSLDELMALPVAQLAGRDCALFLWTRWINLEHALALIPAWGFRYVTGGSWQKRTVTMKKTFGTGYWYRNCTEPYLFGTKGRPLRLDRGIRDSITSPLFVSSIDGQRREHSRKPPEMRANIDALFGDVPGCELFGREPWAGRDVWGNEAAKFGGGLGG